MESTLEQIAEIHKGFPFRLKEDGKVPCLRPKDFDRTGKFLGNVELQIAISEETKKFLLQEGDVLVLCKGPANRAYAYPAELGDAVAIDMFTIIRPSNAIRSQDLIDYLNGEEGQEALKKLRKGSEIPTISHKDLRDLVVPVGVAG